MQDNLIGQGKVEKKTNVAPRQTFKETLLGTQSMGSSSTSPEDDGLISDDDIFGDYEEE